MSLLSIKNLGGPFKNKSHLAAICLVAILFAAFRFSGGAFKNNSTSPDSSNSTITANTQNQNKSSHLSPKDIDQMFNRLSKTSANSPIKDQINVFNKEDKENAEDITLEKNIIEQKEENDNNSGKLSEKDNSKISETNDGKKSDQGKDQLAEIERSLGLR